MLDLENQVMQIIVYAGKAKSLAMESVKLARNGELETAKSVMAEGNESLKEAHRFHGELLSDFAGDQEKKTNLFVVHGEDHMMAAITALDFAKELLFVYERLTALEREKVTEI